MNDVIKSSTEHDLSLADIDRLCDMLLGLGIIFRDTNNLETIDASNDEIYDRSQIDYEVIFQKAIEIDGNLTAYINELRAIQPPQHREEQNIIIQAKEGNPYAENRLISMYLKIVVRIAVRYFEIYGLDLAETIQDGNIGLIIALEKMPMDGSYRFSTYAPWWIRQNITRATNSICGLISMPVHFKDKMFNVIKIIKMHSCNLCIGVDDCPNMLDEICVKTDCDIDTARHYLILLNDHLMYTDEQLPSDELLFEQNMISNIDYKMLKGLISEILFTLKPKEKEVIIERFGFETGEGKTLEEIGRKHEVTRERIRQIEAKAILRLRHPSRSSKLKSYW